MGVNRLSIFQRILVTQLNHWTYFSVLFLYFIVNYARSESVSLHIGAWVLFGLVPAGLYLVRLHINKVLWLWGTHIGIVVLIGLFPMGGIGYKLIYLIITLIYSVISILCYYGKERFSKKYLPIPAYFGITAVLLLFLQYLELHEYQRYCLYLLVFQVFLCSITMYTDHYVEYVGVHKHSIGYMPVQNIFIAGMKVIGFFSAVMALGLTAVASVGEMNDILGFFRKKLSALLKKLMEFLWKYFKDLGKGEETLTENASADTLLLTDVTQEATGSVWADILMLVLFIIVLVFVAKFLLKLLLALYGRLKLPQSMSEEEEISLDVQEMTRSISKEKKRRFDIFVGMSPAERIRKRYKKKIDGSQAIISAKGKREQMELYTARESADILEVPQMAEIYEKARYSPYECTAEDAKRMKQLCKARN